MGENDDDAMDEFLTGLDDAHGDGTAPCPEPGPAAAPAGAKPVAKPKYHKFGAARQNAPGLVERRTRLLEIEVQRLRNAVRL